MRLCIFEGPASVRLAGWRHFLYLDADSGKRFAALGTPAGAQQRAVKNGWQFFPAGTWEQDCPLCGCPWSVCPCRYRAEKDASEFAAIRPEILAKLAPEALAL